MKRINLTKYGFVRWPEEDFSDDGSRFSGFRAGKAVRVSKHVYNGQVYLSIDSSVGKGTLPHDVYSKLPNYNKASWAYNGVSIDSLIDQDLIDFYNACVSYEKEYEAAEANIQYPTIEEITAQCEKITANAVDQYKKASQMIVEAVLDGTIVNLSDYEIKNLKYDLMCLKNATTNYDPKTYPAKIYRNSASFNFVKPDNYELRPKSIYLEEIERYIEKLKNN